MFRGKLTSYITFITFELLISVVSRLESVLASGQVDKQKYTEGVKTLACVYKRTDAQLRHLLAYMTSPHKPILTFVSELLHNGLHP